MYGLCNQSRIILFKGTTARWRKENMLQSFNMFVFSVYFVFRLENHNREVRGTGACWELKQSGSLQMMI